MVYDPISQGAGAYYGGGPAVNAYKSSDFGGGGTDLSGAERRQNELEDVRNYIYGQGGLTQAEIDILTQDMSNGRLEQLTPEQRVARYETYNQSQNNDWKNLISQVMRGDEKIYQQGYDTFRSTFGRAPTSTEWAQLVPLFGGAEGATRGAAAIGNMFEQYKQSPEYLKTQVGQYSDELDPVFKQLLGRNYTQSELDYYGQQLAGGRPQYEIEQMLKQSPEYLQNQDKQFRSGLASELEGYDLSFFDKAKENVISRAAKNNSGYGTSSALDFALTNLMGEIADKRGQYLAGLSSSQYGGNKDAAREDYRTGMNRYFEEQDYNRRKQDADTNYYRTRADEDRDYTRQWNDYMSFMNSQKPGSALHTKDWLNLGLNAANAGVKAYQNYAYLNG